MNVVIWARVSSREQREGYSIDAQLRATRERALRNGWTVVREFEVAESAKRGATREVFNRMFDWVRSNARKQQIQAILSHKLDRVCRNMRDAVRMQELEDQHGVSLEFVDNQFGPGAAGALSFNVMAAVAQYYSDNLRSEVIKGLDEKVRQGWPTGLAPYGYLNTDDKEEPVKPHPQNAQTVVRIFELYAMGGQTFTSLADQLEREGHVFRNSQPRFGRSALSWILNNRFYIGELHRKGQVFEGKYRRLIDRQTFEQCQEILQGKNRRTGSPNMPWSGGLFRCAFCGQAITGERIYRKLKGGGVREHDYYRCANNRRGKDHPVVRWKAADLEQAIVQDLDRMKLASPEIASWFRAELQSAMLDLTSSQRRQQTMLAKRQGELASMQDRLLNAFLAGTVEEATYKAKSQELKQESLGVDESLARINQHDPSRTETALALYDWTQNASEFWRGSNMPSSARCSS